MRAYPALLALVCIVSACGDGQNAEGGGRSGTVVRDSAGITIVESTGVDVEVWHLASEADLVIGLIDGADPYSLYGVRDIDRLADGSWVVTNGGTEEIRVFDAEGEFSRTIGRSGEGPGEFVSLSQTWVLGGDSVAAWDSRQRRMTVFGPSGDVSRTFGFTTIEGGLINPIGPLPDGRWVVRERDSGTISTGGTGRGYPVIPEDRFAITDPFGVSATVFTTLDGPMSWVVESASFAMTRDRIPFQAGTGLTLLGDRIVGGVRSGSDIGVWDTEGAPLARWRLLSEAQPVTDADWDAELEHEIDGMVVSGAAPPIDFEEMAREFYGQVQRPTTWPRRFNELPAVNGDLWTGEYLPLSLTDSSRRWHVYSRDGLLERAVDLPPGFSLLWAGEDRVAGVVEDEFEVEYVHVYALLPKGQAPA